MDDRKPLINRRNGRKDQERNGKDSEREQEVREVKMNLMYEGGAKSQGKDSDGEEDVDCKCCYCKCCHCSKKPVRVCCCDMTMQCILCTFIPIGIVLLLLIFVLINRFM